MRNEQSIWINGKGWTAHSPDGLGSSARLVWVFGSRGALASPGALDELRSAYPEAHLFGCSTAGEICDTRVHDDSLVATAISFREARTESGQVEIDDPSDSRRAGRRLGCLFPKEDLRHVVVLSDGLNVNGSALVAGLTEELPRDVTITGGLSADGDRFQETLIVSNGTVGSRRVAALGFYGAGLEIGYGSLGGWDAFGPERLITRSEGNILFELDGRQALDLYKTYLGEHADGLPATGLLFPLSLRSDADSTPVVRTILGVDEVSGSMTFAGDVPRGSYARLMKANFDRLIDGAAGAARASQRALTVGTSELALLISCVGRKLVLKQRVEEEVENVREVIGKGAAMLGFYSYGEISPFTKSAKCELHNQTMTITTFSER